MFQGDPLPAALVELVRNSPISSIEDLQLLLLTDSVGKDLHTPILLLIHTLKPDSVLGDLFKTLTCSVHILILTLTLLKYSPKQN